MKKIYKYALPLDGKSIQVSDYIIEWLKVDMQNGQPYAWAVVDTEREGMMTEIVAWGTGWILPNDVYYDTEYLGTATDGAGYVWHYFAKTYQTEYLSLTTQDYTLYANGDQSTLSSSDAYYVNDYANSTVSTLNVSPPSISFTVDNVCFDKLLEQVEKCVSACETTTRGYAQ